MPCLHCDSTRNCPVAKFCLFYFTVAFTCVGQTHSLWRNKIGFAIATQQFFGPGLLRATQHHLRFCYMVDWSRKCYGFFMRYWAQCCTQCLIASVDNKRGLLLLLLYTFDTSRIVDGSYCRVYTATQLVIAKSQSFVCFILRSLSELGKRIRCGATKLVLWVFSLKNRCVRLNITYDSAMVDWSRKRYGFFTCYLARYCT